MKTPWTDAENAMWAWLDADPAFKALALKTYRATDGKPPPFDPRDRFWTLDELPCIATERQFTGGTERDHGQRLDLVRLRLRVAYATEQRTGPGASRSATENAASIILDRLTSTAAIRTCLGAPEAIEKLELGAYSFTGWPPDKQSRGQVAVWEWTADLILHLPPRSL